MESSENFELFKQYMRNNFNAKIASGGKEIIKRCHICGDSKDPSDAHMYMGLKNGVIVYNCFKCGAKGVVDNKFLKSMGCYDQNLIDVCTDQLSKNTDNRFKKSATSFASYKARKLLIPISNNDFAIKKFEYIINRLKVDLSIYDIQKFKIILNLKDFLDLNKITNYTRDPSVIELLDKYFLGFLSADNRYVILRRMVPEGKLPQYVDYRFINYNIFNSSDDAKKYYLIPGQLDMNRPVDIHIAEGVFDILSINLNLPNQNPNSIYAAICGKSYEEVIKYLIIQYGFSNCNLHIYPDADINNYIIKSIANKVRIFDIKTFIHRNTFQDQKDFGVSKDLIIDSWSEI